MDTWNQQWPWFAILARTGREKAVSVLLGNSGFECYLPMSKITRRWSDRVRAFEAPLFPGYLFCRMNPDNRMPVLMTPGVFQIVGRGRKPLPVEEQEIAAIQRVEKSDLSTTSWPYLQVGQVARIDAGPLRGMSGIVIESKSGLKLVLTVSLLQRSMAVEIDRSWIGAAYPFPSYANQMTTSSIGYPGGCF